MRTRRPAAAADPAESTRLRFTFLTLLVVSLFVLLFARLWFLQVMAGEQYAAEAEGNRERIITSEAPRGRILDRNGEPLVENRYAMVVSVQPREMGDRGDEVIADLAGLLDISVEEITDRVENSRVSPLRPKPVAVDVPEEVVFYLHENPGNRFPGVYAETLPRRQYPHGRLASHLLGYVGEISGDELDHPDYEDYRPGDLIGWSGLERSYERTLRGEEGIRRLEVDATDQVVRTLEETVPAPGSDLVLTIDHEVQRWTEEALAEGIAVARRTSDHDPERPPTFEAPAGAVVVLEPDSGEIAAMASFPDYEPGAFVGGIDSEVWADLQDPENDYPLINRAIQASYPPGSVFKIVTAAAALEDGFMTPEDRLPCPGSWSWEEQVFHNWKRVDQPPMDLRTALVDSCDTVFYELARAMWEREQATGAEREFLTDQAEAWGFGSRHGIDLPGERRGVVPGRAWRRAFWEENRDTYCTKAQQLEEGSYAQRVNADLCETGDRWRGGDAINFSIGQGDLQATPLQVANAFAALANGGTLYRPHLAREIVHRDGEVEEVEPEALAELPVGAEELAYIEDGLRGVTQPGGTGSSVFADFPIEIAGKTGTAELKPKQPFAWFAGYNTEPIEGQRYVVVAMLEEGGGGSQTAAPIVRKVFEGLFDLDALAAQPIEPGAETE